jgi:hypothetical protein
MLEEQSYTCQSCGEEIVVEVDRSGEREQSYVEDCPVCCCPHLLRVSMRGDEVFLEAEIEE